MRKVCALGAIASFAVLAGCAAKLPPQYDRLADDESAIKHIHSNYQKQGFLLKGTHESVDIFSAHPVQNEFNKFTEEMTRYCATRGGTLNHYGPKLLDDRRNFSACEGSDAPLFFFYYGHRDRSHENLVAEQSPGSRTEDFVSYLNRIGYDTPQQRRANDSESP